MSTTDDRMETITDPAAIRATDEHDERTTPAPMSGAGLDLDAIKHLRSVGLTRREHVDALVAEVERLTDDLAKGGAEWSRMAQEHDALTGKAAASDAWQARAESAEAEVVTLRAKVAEGRRIVGMLAETVESECEDDPDMCHEHDRTDDGRCPLLVDLNRAYAALATTGEGQR